MRKPTPVRAGSRVALVAPASPFPREAFDQGVAELRRLGLDPVFSDDVFARDGYVAGSAARRAADLVRAWSDPTVDAVMAVRGGYGSMQVLPWLDAAAFAASPKLFIGYSDNTAVLSWLTCQCGVSALHGPMIDGCLARGAAAYDERSLLGLLGGGRGLDLAPAGLQTLRGGEALGPLFGGNLTQLVSSMGTPYAFTPPAGAVLFVEDVNERPYRLDRMLTQLAQAGVLSRVVAIVFGEMRGCDEPDGVVTARDAVLRALDGFRGPVLYGFPSGHTTGPGWSLPLGVSVRVIAGEVPHVIVEESVVD